MNGITHVNKFLVTIVNGLRLVIMNDLSVFSYRGDIMNVTCNFKTYIYIYKSVYLYNHREWLSSCHREWIGLNEHLREFHLSQRPSQRPGAPSPPVGQQSIVSCVWG